MLYQATLLTPTIPPLSRKIVSRGNQSLVFRALVLTSNSCITFSVLIIPEKVHNSSSRFIKLGCSSIGLLIKACSFLCIMGRLTTNGRGKSWPSCWIASTLDCGLRGHKSSLCRPLEKPNLQSQSAPRPVAAVELAGHLSEPYKSHCQFIASPFLKDWVMLNSTR